MDIPGKLSPHHIILYPVTEVRILYSVSSDWGEYKNLTCAYIYSVLCIVYCFCIVGIVALSEGNSPLHIYMYM